MRALYNEVMEYKNDRWAVILDDCDAWLASGPQREPDAQDSSRDQGFETHAEAIAYADKEARK